MVGSPGPANIILFALGCTQQVSRSIPFILSVVLSKQLIIWPIGFSLLLINDLIDKVFKHNDDIIDNFYFLDRLQDYFYGSISKRKSQLLWAPRFYHGLLVHPLNPKAWMMIILAFTAFQSQGVSTETIPHYSYNFFTNTINFSFCLVLVWFSSKKSRFIRKK